MQPPAQQCPQRLGGTGMEADPGYGRIDIFTFWIAHDDSVSWGDADRLHAGKQIAL